MKPAKHCHKNPTCRLWQMLCDGSPCLVEKEIESDSNSILSPRINRMWNLSEFKLEELADLAIKIEKTGNQLYKRLAKRTSNEELKNLLLYLAADEKRHMLKLREISKKIIVRTSGPDMEKVFDFVRTLVETHVFNGADKVERLVDGVRSAKDIVRLASDFEKDTIIFLHAFNDMVIDKQAVIENMIKEQQSHLTQLIKCLRNLGEQESGPLLRPKRYPKKAAVSEIA